MNSTPLATDIEDEAAVRPPLKDIVAALEERILASESVIENERRIPEDITNDLYDLGMYRAFMPRELGGLEAHPIDWLEAVEELSRINGSIGWLCMLHTGNTWVKPEIMRPILEKERWITASNVGRAAGKAVRVPGGYRISGKWPFSSGSPEATYLSGRSILYTDDGEQVIHPVDGNPWYVTGYFPRKDVIVYDDWDGLGLRGTGSGHFEVKDLFVPTEMVNELGVHHRTYDRPLYRAPFNVMAHSAHALGLAKAALEEYLKLVHKGVLHGSLRQARLGREQIHQMAAGEADVLIRAARLLVWDTVQAAYDNAHEQAPVDYELRVRMHQANVFAVASARKAIDLVYQQSGSPAVIRGNRMERIYRDIIVACQHTLIGENSYDRVGQYLFTKDLPSGPQIDVSSTGFIQGPHPQFDQK